MPHATEHMSAFRPFGPLTPRAVHRLRLEQIHPVVRVAHHQHGLLRLPERIIYDHELVLVTSGLLELYLAEDRYTLEANHLVLLPPFVPHRFHSEGSLSHVAVHFDLTPALPPEAKGSVLSEREPYELRWPGRMQPPRHVTLTPADGVADRLARVVRCWEEGSPLGRVEARAQLELVLLALLGRGKEQQAAGAGAVDAHSRARLERALARMEANYAQPLTADDLAEAAGLSTSHFNRLFRQWRGDSPMACLRRVRVAKARQLLADPDLSVTQIAQRTGFADVYHFSRVFRHVDGLSPTMYREAVLADRPSAEPGG